MAETPEDLLARAIPALAHLPNSTRFQIIGAIEDMLRQAQDARETRARLARLLAGEG